MAFKNEDISRNPYGRQTINCFDKDFIINNNPEIEVDFWREKIQKSVFQTEYSPEHILFGIKLSGKEEKDLLEGYRFYLEGLEKNCEQIFQALKSKIKGCNVIHEKIGHTWKTWILITYSAQKKINFKKQILGWIKKRFKLVDICLLFLCIFIVIYCIIQLNKHWEGYERPWKNLVTFMKDLGLSNE